MGFFSKLFGKKDATLPVVATFACAKCGKVKKEGEGRHDVSGMSFCCSGCCGNVEAGEHTQKSEKSCEACG